MKLFRLWRLRAQETLLDMHMRNGKALIRDTEAQLERDRVRLRETIDRLRKTRRQLSLIEPPRNLIGERA